MTDKIHIVYNWIGPRGPIINTELPNILSFSAVTENVAVDSLRFWCDDVFHRFFLHDPRFQLSSASTIAINNSEDVFIYPLTLTWRIQFNTYFYTGSGILEYAHTSGHIIHHVRGHNGYFLIDLSAEAFVQPDQLESMHTYFSSFGIPMGKIIYLTGCMNAKTVYNRWCDSHGVPNNPRDRIKMISFPVSHDSLSRHLNSAPEPEYDINTVPEKLFLSWNRRYRPHRTALALALESHNLIDRSYVSMGLVDPENPNYHFSHTVDLFRYLGLDLSQETANRFISKLPLVLDGETDTAEMCSDFTAKNRRFYQNSLVSLITETNFDLDELTLTEKSFKPFKEKHPMIIIGVPGALAALRELGFKTFSEFWDESYDEIPDANLRLSKIGDICRQIGQWDNQKILDFKARVRPILQHNYDNLKIQSKHKVLEQMVDVVRNNV
jgi:hypothetical protein